jgi:hypothetical protein
MAVGVEATLDQRLCQIGLDRAVTNQERRESSDMFAPPVRIAGDAPFQDRLLGIFGRDPSWKPTPS